MDSSNKAENDNDKADDLEEGQIQDDDSADDIEVLDNVEQPRSGDQSDNVDVHEDDRPHDKRLKSSETLEDSDDDGIKIIDEVSKSSTGGGELKSGEGKDSGGMGADDDDDDDDRNMPTIRLNTGIFAADDDDDEEEQNAADVMEMEMDTNAGGSRSTLPRMNNNNNDLLRRSTPRRAAAQAAANSIKVMTDILLDKGQSLNQNHRDNAIETHTQKVQCHQCKKFQASQVVVQQFGTDIHLCSNACFNAFRNPDPARRPLACSKCGTLSRDTDTAKTFYWETMNFCSDICVCKFQMEIGSKCSTCSIKVVWTSLGKYCVRFGSDIRQFCSATCLEAYKKNARVCFHCQLDIKRLGNVILANIPAKAQPKEFCSQECVEMYVEQNLNQQIISKPDVMVTCVTCAQYRKLLKAVVLNGQTYQTCSEYCWKRLLETRLVQNATKCETCTKFVNMETLTPSFYLASDTRTFGFCSATCKNVYVLKNRQILACTTCKVKKYNYDLIEFVNGHKSEYVVCSLNCLPRPSQYVLNLKASLLSLVSTASNLILPKSTAAAQTSTTVVNTGQGFQIQPLMSMANIGTGTSTSTLMNGINGLNVNGAYSLTDGSPEIMLRQACDDDIIEIRDGDVSEENISLDDERWAECETLVIVREPEPVPMRNKGCMAKPIRITKETQTETDELWEMPRVEMRPREAEPIIRYVPVVIPCPVYIPVPFYALQAPVPVPLPVPVPVPIPLPVDTTLLNAIISSNQTQGTSTASEEPTAMEVDSDDT